MAQLCRFSSEQYAPAAASFLQGAAPPADMPGKVGAFSNCSSLKHELAAVSHVQTHVDAGRARRVCYVASILDACSRVVVGQPSGATLVHH
jgi:hypothetical protein